MSHSFEATKRGYANLWDKAKLTNPAGAKAVAQKIIANRGTLQRVEDDAEVPWWLVGCWLYRESDLDFNSYLGNGQSIYRRTTEVPAGRGPWTTFYEAAIDAIQYEDKVRGGGFYKVGKATWTLEYALWSSEEWNGEGYENKGVNSPYIWDWTNLYTGGLFIADHQFSVTQRENRAGVAAIMMALFEIDPTLKPSRIAQEKQPMATPTTTTAPAVSTMNTAEIANIIKVLDTGIGYLPIISTFIPQLKVVTPFIPLVQGVLKLAEDLSAAPHDPHAIVDIIVAHLQDIATNVQAVKAQIPATPVQPAGT